DRAGAAYAAILGERELAEGPVTLRRLADGEQQVVAVADVVRWMRAASGTPAATDARTEQTDR
ncbi:MAG: His/Gly/Thr/Pro-type tRNA ligase C-terminal domain-containing protein, partial [Actinomycetota bacterium]